MKKYIALLISFVVCLSVCACTNDTPSVNTPESTEPAATDAPETTAAETEAPVTEFVPTEDNVVWAISPSDLQGVSDMMPPFFGSPLEYVKDGEPYIDNNVKELFKRAEGKRIAVSVCYAEKSDRTDSGWFIGVDLLDIPEEYILYERYCFLTVDEIEALAEKTEGDTNARLVILAEGNKDYDAYVDNIRYLERFTAPETTAAQN